MGMYVDELRKHTSLQFTYEFIGAEKRWYVDIKNLYELETLARIIEREFRASIQFNVYRITILDCCDKTLDYIYRLRESSN